jgi:hypothetical protein
MRMMLLSIQLVLCWHDVRCRVDGGWLGLVVHSYPYKADIHMTLLVSLALCAIA